MRIEQLRRQAMELNPVFEARLLPPDSKKSLEAKDERVGRENYKIRVLEYMPKFVLCYVVAIDRWGTQGYKTCFSYLDFLKIRKVEVLLDE